MKLLEQIPKGHVLHFGPHGRRIPGFHAEIIHAKSEPYHDWFKCSHGSTPEEAIKNALARINDKPETLYEPGYFLCLADYP